MRWTPLAPLAVASLLVASRAEAEASYRLPWPPGISVELTQDCHDTHYADHVGQHGWAWDFAAGGAFPVVAARGGVVTHMKQTSRYGCGSPDCVDWANYVVVDHGDGTASVYLHLEGGSLDPALACGHRVEQGQHLGTAGSTGWATGPHLHFQVDRIPVQTTTCECGEDGNDCRPDEVPWSTFWSSEKRPTQPVRFDEWDADRCDDRRLAMPMSTNLPAPPGEAPANEGTRLASEPAPGGKPKGKRGRKETAWQRLSERVRRELKLSPPRRAASR